MLRVTNSGLYVMWCEHEMGEFRTEEIVRARELLVAENRTQNWRKKYVNNVRNEAEFLDSAHNFTVLCNWMHSHIHAYIHQRIYLLQQLQLLEAVATHTYTIFSVLTAFRLLYFLSMQEWENALNVMSVVFCDEILTMWHAWGRLTIC